MAKRTRIDAAAAAIAADNPTEDDGKSVDDMEVAPARRGPGRPPKSASAPTPAKRGRPARKPVAAAPARGRLPHGEDAVPMRAVPRRDPTAARSPLREPMRDPQTGRIVIVREGKTYTRRHTNVGDKFHIDKSDIPDGMSYQWIAMTIMGAEQRNTVAGFQQNGWEPVDMSRYPGRYSHLKATGHIVIDGLGLYERPEELTQEARDEEIMAARDLIRTRNDQFVPRLPEARARRGTELRAKRSIEGMPTDIGRPSYQMDVDDGLV
jgi:hypothetical protein